MLSFVFNVRMSEKLHMDITCMFYIRVYLTALLEYIPDCSIRVCRSFKQVLKRPRAHVTSVNPSREMNASFINCCAVLYYTHSFCPATLNGVLGSCLQKSKFYRGVPEPPGTPLPTPLISFDTIMLWPCNFQHILSI